LTKRKFSKVIFPAEGNDEIKKMWKRVLLGDRFYQVTLIFLIFIETSQTQPSTVCPRLTPSRSFQCIFNEEYFEQTSLPDDISRHNTKPKILYTRSTNCRTHTWAGGGIDFICDAANLTEIPKSEEFPKNLTRFILNKTKVEMLK
jgi:hypothetical protein